MDLDQLLQYQWNAMLPEFIILGVAVLLSVLDLFWKKQKPSVIGWLGFIGIIAATISLITLFPKENVSILYDTFVLDHFAKVFKLLLLIATAIVFLFAIGYRSEDSAFPYSEFYYLFLTALLGAMMMSSSADLITLFVGLELLSISSYILVGLRKKNVRSNEAAMKYVINGGIASAITLFGLSYVYGLSGSTKLGEIAYQFSLSQTEEVQYLLGISFLLVFIGLSFKIATVPFHMWVPDVYEGAPIPVTSFLSVVSKSAGFIILIRMILSIFGQASLNNENSVLEGFQTFLIILTMLTMIVGNAVALKQQNVKRMLAYSSIAHAGFILASFVSFSPYFYLDAIWFYLIAYTFMNVGAFAVIYYVKEKTGSEHISSFAGLYHDSPVLAISMTIFLLSLAGIPGTAGFIAKFNIFLSTLSINQPLWILAITMIVTTIVSYVYYFGVLVQIYFRQTENVKETTIHYTTYIVIGLCIIGTILLGIFPNFALDFL